MRQVVHVRRAVKPRCDLRHAPSLTPGSAPASGDRIGWSWAVLGFDQEVPKCMGTAPMLRLDKGGYTVRD
ncbi:hypothetical protein [Microtetraspora sp. NBRC 16547]|uniref:hypothetical protein n=1 Tax=Microtetraspora sp. NBRC 16547 TaxID=3030993 RepID=UPI0025521EF6|nr:hypothetical protein [Microtetraspora sp. NBRC 16547]